MGILIRVNDGDYAANALRWVAPVPEGLEYANFFGGSADTLTRNLAPNKKNSIVIGTPTVNPNSVTFGRLLGGIQTAVADIGGDHTFIAVAKLLDDTQGAVIIGNNNTQSQNYAGGCVGASIYTLPGTPANGNLSLFHNQATTNGSSGTSVSASINEAAPGMVQDTPAVITGVFDSVADTRYVYNETDESSSSSVGVGNPLDLGGNFLIGTPGRFASNLSDQVEMMFAGIWRSSIGADQRQAMYEFLVDFYATKGIAL